MNCPWIYLQLYNTLPLDQWSSNSCELRPTNHDNFLLSVNPKGRDAVSSFRFRMMIIYWSFAHDGGMNGIYKWRLGHNCMTWINFLVNAVPSLCWVDRKACSKCGILWCLLRISQFLVEEFSVLQNIYQTAMRHWKKVLEVDWKAGTQDYVYNNRLHAMW